MFRTDSLKTYIFFWVTLLALCMALLLSYQSTQYFLKGLDMITGAQMEEAADLLPAGKREAQIPFGYHVAADWQAVPQPVREVFGQPPQQLDDLQIYFEDWWYFAPPKRAYFLMASRNAQGEVRYITRHKDGKRTEEKVSREGLDPMVKIALWGLGAIAVYIALIYRILGNLARPIEALHRWASSLKLESLTRDRPDFQYRELNELATIIHNSLLDVSQTLAREREFLGFASHELRTPIATLRSNATLLDKVSPHPGEKEREVRDRILRASLTMKGITETLLWLNRDEQQLTPMAEVDIAALIQRVVEEQRYLLSGKAVSVQLTITAARRTLPTEAFAILLTNMVRNAFQHTASGEVIIDQREDQITVTNSLTAPNENSQAGFGLGMKLIQKLVKRFEWQLLESHTADQHCIQLQISQQADQRWHSRQ